MEGEGLAEPWVHACLVLVLKLINPILMHYYYIALDSQYSLSHGHIVLLIFLLYICGTVCTYYYLGQSYRKLSQ